jgi:cytochrome c oxidase subunit IV
MARYTSTFEWLLLLALTGLSVGLAETGLPGTAVLIPVLLATLIKGRIVIDRFMALQQAAPAWRWVVLGWMFVVVGLIAYAFRIAELVDRPGEFDKPMPQKTCHPERSEGSQTALIAQTDEIPHCVRDDKV